MWIFPISLFFLVLGIICAEPTITIFLYSISALLISYIVYRHTGKLAPANIALRMIVLSSMMQFLWISIYLVTRGSSIVLGNTRFVFIDFEKFSFITIYALLIFPMCALFVAYLFSKFSVQRPIYRHAVNKKKEKCFEVFLSISAFYLIFYYIGAANLSFLSAFFMYSYLGLIFTPFLIGYFSHQYKRPAVIFMLVYISTATFALAGGSRSHVFIPPILFFIGYIQHHLSSKKIIIVLTVIMLIAPFALSISAGIEDVRQSVRMYQEDKETLLNVTTEILPDINTIISSAVDYAKSDILQGVQKGIARLIIWTNFAVLTMSPDPIPFRGFSDFLDEIRWRFGFSFLDPNSAEDETTKNFGIGAANIYGFEVVHGGTVPFSCFADTWSRGGLIYTVFSGILICLLFGIIECFIRRIYSKNYYFSIFFITVLASVAFDCLQNYSMLYTIKFLLISTVFWLVLLKVYFIIYNFCSYRKLMSQRDSYSCF